MPRSLRFLSLPAALVLAACSDASPDDAPVIFATAGTGGLSSSGAAGTSTGRAGAASEVGGRGGTEGGQAGTSSTAGSGGGGGASGASGSSTGPGGANAGMGGALGGDGGAGGQPSASGLARYLPGVRHSPYTKTVIETLKAARGVKARRIDVFSKLGASATADPNFFRCFAGEDVKLGALADLAETRDFFRKTLIGADNSFDRISLAAVSGWGAKKLLEGDPSPLAQELEVADPGYAVMMFGTNDTFEQGVIPYEKAMRANIDALLAEGVVPLVSTIMPRADAEPDALVSEMNAILRAVAQSRQVPLMDLWLALQPLPEHGLGSDGIHLKPYPGHPCWLDEAGLTGGTNQRNLIALEALHRARGFVEGGLAAEPSSPELAGKGSPADPFVVDALPFVDARSTSEGGSVLAAYACAKAKNEGGPEIVYRLDLPAARKLSLRVFGDDGVDPDIHFLSAPTAEACVARDDKRVVVDAPAGASYVVVDSFVSGGSAKAGAYRLTIVPL